MAENTSANDHSPQDEEIPLNVKIKTEVADESFQQFDYSYVCKVEKLSDDSQPSESQTASTSTTSNCASGASKDVNSNQHNSSLSSSVPESEPKPKAIDYKSKLGQFAWTSVGEEYLPFLTRGEDDRFVAVRMIECKILNAFVDVLPWTVFACTNIKSYYITENEARLLNEINGFHCEFDYGYQTFSTKDVIVRLKDAIRFHKFLESCRTRLQPDNPNPEFEENCGFVMMNSTATPYIKKGKKKYVLYDMACTENMKSSVPEAKFQVSEWDLAYFRFLSSIARISQSYLLKGASLCSLEDLQKVFGVKQFEEWWPNVQYPSKNDTNSLLEESDSKFSKHGEFLSFMQPEAVQTSQKLREKCKDSQLSDPLLNPFFEYDRHSDVAWRSSKSPHTVQTSLDAPQSVQSIESDSRESLFPSSLERLLATSNQSISYESQFTQQMQSLISGNATQPFESEGGLSSLATSRPKPFPPPPPLVRVEETPQSTTVPVINHTNPTKSPPPSLYSYMHPACPPWLSHILDSQSSSHQASEFANAPMNHSRMMIGEDPWNLSNSALHGGAVAATGIGSFNSFCRDDRLTSFPRGSPRPAASAGAPPYYPTPPQSSPLQPVSILDCPPLPGITDIYGVRAMPHGLGEICSPPPSPETRTALPTSPRGAYGATNGYPAHITRLAQVDSRYLLAINTEPYKHNSVLAVPISDVVSKFLRGSSVESCQVTLETVFGLQLFKCTSLHQEAYAKHNVVLIPDSKLVSVVDLRNYLYQLRCMLSENEKQKDSYDINAVDLALPLPKRWCGDQQGMH